jgi:hypothetical protein
VARNNLENASFPLQADEVELLAAINLDSVTHVTYDKNGELVIQLVNKLLARKAIPQHRLRYFNDPEYSGVSRGRSWQQVFESNGTRGEEILRHPSFLKYLRYFIFGPDLPKSVIAAFTREVENCGNVTSGDAIPLSKFARKQARELRMNPHEADVEFYKLALDCGMSPDYAEYVKRAVRGIRYT